MLHCSGWSCSLSLCYTWCLPVLLFTSIVSLVNDEVQREKLGLNAEDIISEMSWKCFSFHLGWMFFFSQGLCHCYDFFLKLFLHLNILIKNWTISFPSISITQCYRMPHGKIIKMSSTSQFCNCHPLQTDNALWHKSLAPSVGMLGHCSLSVWYLKS